MEDTHGLLLLPSTHILFYSHQYAPYLFLVKMLEGVYGSSISYHRYYLQVIAMPPHGLGEGEGHYGSGNVYQGGISTEIFLVYKYPTLVELSTFFTIPYFTPYSPILILNTSITPPPLP